MANIKKNFNFRNGVQVDDDNLLVTDTGLVGIGTTIPNEALDVRGNIIVTGFTSTTTARIGVLTVDSSTNASSKDTGALIITAGGLGVEGNIHSGGDIVAFSSSDMTLKKDISPIEDALGLINSLSGNTFTWKPEAGIMGNSGMDTGIIAQEVEALNLPGISKRRGDGTLGVRYDRLIPVLIEAVKELTAKVNSLENNK